MASQSIQLFKFFQNFHQAIGIGSSQFKENSSNSSRLRTKFFLIICAQFVFTSIGFLPFEAKSMLDYGFGFFVLTTIISATIIYLLFIWQSHDTLKFIENCEGFIERGKYETLNVVGIF